jgi:RHS repeat-associated protein
MLAPRRLFAPKPRRSVAGSRPNRRRLLVEPLESRTLLSTVTWDGKANTYNWNDRGNWDSNAVPGATDDVVIPALTGNPTIVFSGGSSTINSLQSAAALSFDGGTFAVNNTVMVTNADMTLSGGTLRGGVWEASGGILQLTDYQGTGYDSTLDGVTLAGDTTLRQGLGSLTNNDGNQVQVLNGLTLDSATLRLERPSSIDGTDVSADVGLNFVGGDQTLGGTGVVELYSNAPSAGAEDNVRVRPVGGGSLTIGPGITIQNTANSAFTTLGDATGGTLIIQGTVLAQSPGQTLRVTGSTVTNTGTLESVAGTLDVNNLTGDVNGTSISYTGGLDLNGTYVVNQPVSVPSGNLTLQGTWSNASTITQSGGTIDLGGTFTVADLGAFPGSAGSVTIFGTLDDPGATLTIDSARAWQVSGGTLRGVTIDGAPGALLQLADFQGTGYDSTLDGVTLGVDTTAQDGLASLTNNEGNQVQVLDGLTLAGATLRLERLATGIGAGSTAFDVGLNFSGGAQTLGGSGTVELFSALDAADAAESNVRVRPADGGSLTIGPGITIEDDTNSMFTTLGDPTLPLTIQGTVLAQSSGQTLRVTGSTVTNQGVLKTSQNGTLQLNQSVAVDGSGILGGSGSGIIDIRNNLIGDTQNADSYNPQGTVLLDGFGTAAAPQLLEAMSVDLGSTAPGFNQNFVYGTLALGNQTYVKLVDQSVNSGGTGPEAVYASSVVVPSGTTLDLNGLHLYARAAQVGGTILNGSISQLSPGGPIALGNPTPGAITSMGGQNSWQFYGRAGRSYTIVVDPGSAGELAPVAPKLGWAQVQVLDASGNVLGTAASASAGAIATLSGLTLPADGTYQIQVGAALGNASATGNYLVTAYDATPNVATLNLNQLIDGNLANVYSLDRWNFASVAGQQVQFNLLNSTSASLRFSLSGPAGFTGFTDATGSSGLITLNVAGNYSLTVHDTGDAGGAYAFRLDETTQTALTVGTTYQGTFVGGGQPQLFTVAVPQAQQFLVSLQGLSPADSIELYAQFGAPPTRADYQYVSATPGSTSENVLVPMAAPGTWYILVYAAHVAAPPEAYSLTAAVSPVTLTAVSPNRLGNAEDAVLTLTGAGFDATTTVSLVAGNGTTYRGNQVQLDFPTQVSATFTAGTVPAGVYSVRVASADGATATLSNAFTMDQGGAFHFQANLVVPSTLGYHTATTLYLRYSNTGDLPMPAPILAVTVFQTHTNGTTDQKALLTLDPSIATQGLWTSTVPAGFSNTIQILASGATPGVLEPGESIQVPIYYAGWQQPWDFSYPDFDPEVGYEDATDTTPIPWSTLQANFQPPNISTTAWNAMFPNLEAQVGNTWGNFVQRLDSDAAYLGHLGENITDLSQLWSFEVQLANGGLSPLPTLSSNTDAEVSTPGPALTVNRAFPNSIQARNQLGPFGWGWEWTDGWQQVLSVENGAVIITNPDGSQRVFEPDRRGGYFDEPGDTAILRTTSGGGFTLQDSDGSITGFNPNGTVAYMEDTNGNVVNAVYTSGLLTSLVATTGQSLTFTWNSAGRITSVTDSTGRTTTYAYDASNQYLLSATDFAGRVTYYTYNASNAAATAHALLSVQTPDGNTDYFNYDADGRLAETQNDGDCGCVVQQATYVYGPAGNVSTTNADGDTTQYSFDTRGLLVKVVDALGNTTHYFYDNNFNLTEVIDPAGQITTYTYDQNRNLLSTTDPDGATVNFTYAGPFNDLTSSTDPNGNTTNYSYNSQGNLLSITYPNETTQQFSYNPVGDLTETVNGKGQPINMVDDSMGLVTQETLADGTTESFTYDVHGNMLTATNSTGTTTFQYDPVTEDLLEVSYPGGFTLTFKYDPAGQRIQSVDQSGFTVNYTYFKGLLSGLEDGNGNTIVAYTYDHAARLIKKVMGNGTYTTYTYDADGDILDLTNYAPNGSINSEFDYTYNNLGLVTSMTTVDGEWAYQYDPAGQLTQAVFVSNNTSVVPNQNLQHFYDLAGNRTQTIINGVKTNYVVNNMNQYTQIGSETLSYDADGNLISQIDSTGTTTYSYNELNQLIGVSSPTTASAYQYGPLGNLVASTQNGQTTQYLVDPVGLGNVVGTYTGSGSLIADYTSGLGLTSAIPSGGQASYYDFDALGSTVGLTGGVGSYIDQYSYLPFGEGQASIETVPNPFTYVGEFGVMQEGNGLEFMRARFYSPSLGRFNSSDPLRLSGGDNNRYRYARNNPVSLVDPTGNITLKDIEELYEFYENLETAGELAQAESPGRLCVVGAEFAGGELGGWAGEATGAEIGGAIGFWIGGLGAIPGVFIGGIVGKILGSWGGGKAGEKAGEELCPPPWPSPTPTPTPPSPAPSVPIRIDITKSLRSRDPNEKTGPGGFGPQGFITGDSVLPYRITFENDPTATAPAQRVVITDPLDPNIDWSTLQFTEVGFGDNIITIPAGSQHFQTTVSMTDNGLTFNVLIELGLNMSTGLITATFQSIDPTTDLPPDVLTGFLPPEDGTGRGMGYFSYTVMPRAGLPTGTQIRNIATVTFDVNPPITTDQVNENDSTQGVDPAKQDLNTIDAGAPTSSVAQLPATETSAGFTVTWSGQDDPGGSGVASFDVFVSTDGGPFVPWLTATTLTQATFSGSFGHKYSFYSVAMDNVGNVEPTPSSPEATTQILSTETMCAVQASVNPADFSDSITFTATVTSAIGTATPTGSVQFVIDGTDFGAPIALSNGMATSDPISTLAPGNHSITAQYLNTDGQFTPTTGSLAGGLTVAKLNPSTTLTASTLSPSYGVSWTITATVANGPGRPTPGGTVQFVVDGANIGPAVMLVGGQATSPDLAALGAGPHAIAAAYSGDADNLAGNSPTANLTVTPAPVYVLGLKEQTVKVHRKKLNVIAIVFSGDLDPGSAQNLSNYQLTTASRGRKSGRAAGKPIPLKSATYDPRTRTVTLTAKKPLSLSQPVRLRIIGSGIRSAWGQALDGQHNGQPGGDFLAILTGRGVSILRDEPPRIAAVLSARAVDSLLETGEIRLHRLS